MKNLVLCQKANFSSEKAKTKMFLESGRIVAQKMFIFCFFVFPKIQLIFWPNTIFFLGISWFFSPKLGFSSEKIGFSTENHLVPRKRWFFSPEPGFSWEKLVFHYFFPT